MPRSPLFAYRFLIFIKSSCLTCRYTPQKLIVTFLSLQTSSWIYFEIVLHYSKNVFVWPLLALSCVQDTWWKAEVDYIPVSLKTPRITSRKGSNVNGNSNLLLRGNRKRVSKQYFIKMIKTLILDFWTLRYFDACFYLAKFVRLPC